MRHWRSFARLWSEDSVDYRRAALQLTGASISPLPVQPDLPMWIGGRPRRRCDARRKYGTGWQAGAETPATVGRVIADIKTARWRQRAGVSTRITTGPRWLTGLAGRTIRASRR